MGGENPGLGHITSLNARMQGPLEVDCVVATGYKQAEERRAQPEKSARMVVCVSPGSREILTLNQGNEIEYRAQGTANPHPRVLKGPPCPAAHKEGGCSPGAQRGRGNELQLGAALQSQG